MIYLAIPCMAHVALSALCITLYAAQSYTHVDEYRTLCANVYVVKERYLLYGTKLANGELSATCLMVMYTVAVSCWRRG